MLNSQNTRLPTNDSSRSKNKKVEVEIADLRKITEVVKSKYRYDFSDYAMSSLRRRIQRIIDLYSLTSVSQLLEKIESDVSFFDVFLSEVTVNVTEMFRDPSFWREIRDHVVPGILLNHDSFSIWHAGCSSGEEVISMSILLQEMGISDRVNIIATDIDKPILQKAMAREYSMKNMELNEKNYIRFQGTKSLSKYYTERGGKAVMDPSLTERVSYRNYDLVQGEVFNKFDLILCRNVMIYFNQTLQNNVLKRLHESLFKYGYLAVGSKESLIWCEISNKFIIANNEEKIYKKIKE